MKVEAYYPQRLFISLVILLCVLALGPAMGDLMDCQAQEGVRRAPGKPPNGPDVIGAVADVSEDYRINPGDVIEIQVDRAPELSGMRRVTASGKIRLQYLGPVTANGKTADELAGFIADSLRGRYLKNPRVTVTIEQMNSHTFFIQGAVNRPGAYQMEGHPSLLTLVTVAGGLKENHGSTAFIIRGRIVRRATFLTRANLRRCQSRGRNPAPQSRPLNPPRNLGTAIRRRRIARVMS
jgi:protein involved in polysaccharide export with SLBB domain